MPNPVRTVWSQLAGTFLAGLFALLPLVITIAIVGWVADFVRGFVGSGSIVGNALNYLGARFVDNAVLASVIGWVLVLGVIFLVGLLVRSKLWRLVDWFLAPVINSIPVVNSVYNTAAQFVGMMNKSEDSELKGMQVVFCKFGGPEGTGLLALMPTPDVFEMGGQRYHIVYIPTSPLPMTGGMIYMPVDDVTPIDMPVDGLMSIYLSMGVSAPGIKSTMLRLANAAQVEA